MATSSRWSRQLAPSNLSPEDKSQRRLSRLSPSDFDSILQSDKTLVLQATDESQLGRGAKGSPDPSSGAFDYPDSPGQPVPASPLTTTTSGGSRDELTSPASPPKRKSSLRLHPLPAIPPVSPAELKRRSVHRGAGTASSPDLASLVRKAKEGRASVESNRDLPDPPKPESPMEHLQDAYAEQFADASPPRASTSSSSTTSAVGSSSSSRTAAPPRVYETTAQGVPPSTPPPRPRTAGVTASVSVASKTPPPVFTQLSVPTDLQPSSARRSRESNVSVSSYVHVPYPSEDSPETRLYPPALAPPPPTDSRHASVMSLAMEGFSPKRRRAATGSAVSAADDGQKSTFSNTMRNKTSRFFRKLGGGATPAPPTKPTSSSSAPGTPIAAAFTSQSSNVPPVPSIPSSYARSSSLSRDDRPSFSSASSRPELGSRKPSVDITIHSARRPSATSTTSPSKTSQSLSRDGSNQSLGVGNTRRRSLSLNSATAAGHLLNNGSIPGSSSSTPRRTEEERLKRELQRWKIDLDGVLGSIGDGPGRLSPDLTRSHPPVPPLVGPQIDLPTFTPLEAAFTGRPTSSPRRPSWNADWATKQREQQKLDSPPPTVTQRSASLPTSAPLTNGGAARTVERREKQVENPSLVVNSPRAGGTQSTLSDDEKPVPPLPTNQALTPPLTEPYVEAEDGLPNGLATISEAHSRESSAATTLPSSSSSLSTLAPPSFVFTQTPSSPPTTTSIPAPSSIVNASASPSPTSSPAPKLSNMRNKAARQSVVAYPSTASSSSALAGSSLARPGRSSSIPASSASLSSTAATLTTGAKKSVNSVVMEDSLAEGEEEENEVDEEENEKARNLAKRCWDEDESFLERRKIAQWLGSAGALNVAALRQYIEFFNFTGLRLDMAFRRLCEKLYLKAETQQVDRILEQFSRRYWETNPKTVYGSADIVHAVSYSLLLLNTDLHVVDSTTRMTRNQFVRNTLSAIQAQSEDPEADENNSATPPALLFRPTTRDTTTGGTPIASPEPDVFGGVTPSGDVGTNGGTISERPSTARSLSSTSWKSASTTGLGGYFGNGSSPTVSRVFGGAEGMGRTRSGSGTGTGTGTPVEGLSAAGALDAKALEMTLKDMYNAIRSQPIFQPQTTVSGLSTPSDNRSTTSLVPANSPYATWSNASGSLARSTTRRSATSSVTAGSSSMFNSKRASVRAFGSFLGAGTTNSSLELMRSSSPTPSTATSLSDDHYSTAYGAQHHHHHVPTIGFANSLSHTIIREQQEDDTKSDDDGVFVTDEELALLGAPWAKEGLLHRKHYWESVGKRAKEKNWLQAFVVVSAGELKMFRFDGAGSSRGGGGGMGGGDWTSNAQNVGAVSLTHALCSAMPPPGYSRDRPHCLVLTLPSGGSYFFQAGTQDLVGEWVATCNYWSARLSKEPGWGVSNMDYGWRSAVPEDDGSLTSGARKSDDVASVRSGKSGRALSTLGGATNTTLGDRSVLSDWKPEVLPSVPSKLSEEAQLDNLKTLVGLVKAELARHNAIRAPMLRLYSPRSVNLAKANANWERKSQYYLSELVKYQTYIEALSSAIKLRALKRGQKEVELMLASADDDEDLVMSPTDTGPPSQLELEKSAEVEEDEGIAVVGGQSNGIKRRSRPANVSTASVTTNGGDDEFFDSQGTPTDSIGPSGD